MFDKLKKRFQKEPRQNVFRPDWDELDRLGQVFELVYELQQRDDQAFFCDFVYNKTPGDWSKAVDELKEKLVLDEDYGQHLWNDAVVEETFDPKSGTMVKRITICTREDLVDHLRDKVVVNPVQKSQQPASLRNFATRRLTPDGIINNQPNFD